jgi:hypothetical protein
MDVCVARHPVGAGVDERKGGDACVALRGMIKAASPSILVAQ